MPEQRPIRNDGNAGSSARDSQSTPRARAFGWSKDAPPRRVQGADLRPQSTSPAAIRGAHRTGITKSRRLLVAQERNFTVATLTAFKFPTSTGADEMLARLRQLQAQGLITVEDAAIVRWP